MGDEIATVKKPMIIFLLVFLTIYGGLNFYCFWKLHRLMPGRAGAQAALGCFVALMTLGPILTRWLERQDWMGAAYGYGMVAYLWMAGVLWFGFLAGLGDLWNLGAGLASRAWPGAGRLVIPFKVEMAGIGALLALAFAWGAVSARRIRLERLDIRSPRYHGAPLRILQISDVHLGLIERGRRLDQIVGIVERTRPDLILSTGDLVDGTGDHLNHLYERLAAVRPRLGKFAVTGNHEYYVGIGTSVAFHQAAGFRLLRGEAVELEGGLRLVGVNDPTERRLGDDGAVDESALLGPARDGRFTILMKHQPRVAPESAGRFDLMLSGHTHRGQIFPFGLLVRLFFPHLSGTHELEGGGALHISRGTGTWGPPLRLGSPPEATLITLAPAGREAH